MNIIIFGTGNANATKCYNTCFMLKENNFNLLVDGGGGNEILNKLKKHNIELSDIHNIFLTHSHTDHIFGIIWIIRMIGQSMRDGNYDGILNVYASSKNIEILDNMCKMLLPIQAMGEYGKRILLNTVFDKQTVNIDGKDITFFDVNSNKFEQFGFNIQTEKGKNIMCLGDTPYNLKDDNYILNCELLMHEAFCLESEADIFKPYDKFHSTVKEPAKLAKHYNIPQLLLYHTVDNNYQNRKILYTNEAKKYYSGNIIVPNDDETITI